MSFLTYTIEIQKRIKKERSNATDLEYIKGLVKALDIVDECYKEYESKPLVGREVYVEPYAAKGVIIKPINDESNQCVILTEKGETIRSAPPMFDFTGVYYDNISDFIDEYINR